MPRHSRPSRDPLVEARSAVRELGPPFEAIAQALNNALATASLAELTPEQLVRLSNYVLNVVRSLPRTQGERFWFDAGLVRAMSDDWSPKKLFSPIIIPCYATQWGYARLPMPLSEPRSDSGEVQAHVVDLIFLPKDDDLGQVALLDYPWIAHELAHNLMFRYGHLLIPLIEPPVVASVSRQRLAAIADRGRVRAASQNARDEFIGFWLPTENHQNWAHELSADMIATWVLGPVYLAAFEDLLEDAEQNPFQVSMIHPPYAVRVTALLRAARRLQCAGHANGLEKLFAAWQTSKWRTEKTNRYRALADPDVIDGVIDGAFKFCEQLSLRSWSNDRVSLLSSNLSSSMNHELGTDLLISAWLAFARHGQENYEHWESKVVQAIANSFKP
jgi:hypothetical protein